MNLVSLLQHVEERNKGQHQEGVVRAYTQPGQISKKPIITETLATAWLSLLPSG